MRAPSNPGRKLATLVAASFVAFSASAWGAGPIDLGKREYDTNCAICHGPKAHGDGAYAGLLTKSIPDLTGLAKRNGGIFPLQRVYETILNGPAVTSHGTSEMPIWGAAYRQRAGEHYFDVPYDAEAYVRTRILALAEYLNRLQQK